MRVFALQNSTGTSAFQARSFVAAFAKKIRRPAVAAALAADLAVVARALEATGEHLLKEAVDEGGRVQCYAGSYGSFVEKWPQFSAAKRAGLATDFWVLTA